MTGIMQISQRRILDKIKQVNRNNDTIHKNTKDFKDGFIEGLEWVLNNGECK